MALPHNTLYFGASTGVSTYVSITATDKFQLQNQSFSVMIWHQLDLDDSSLDTGEKFLVGTNTFGLRVLNGQYVWGLLATTGVAANIPAGDSGTWVHLCGQFDNTKRQWSLYRNSHFLGSATGRGPTGADPMWYLGGRSNLIATTQGLDLSAVWLFGSIVSVDNLRALYMPYVGRFPSRSWIDTLIGYWPVSDGSGTVITDYSGITPLADGNFADSSLTWQTSNWSSSLVFVDLGGDINATIQTIQNASAENPYNIYISHGDFGQQVTMKPWLTLIGAGQGLTVIDVIAPTAAPFGSLILANNVAVRQLEVLSTSKSNSSSVCGIETPEGPVLASLNNLTIYSDGSSFSGTVKGISILSSTEGQISLSECIINTVRGGVDTVITSRNISIKLDNCVIQSLSAVNAVSIGLVTSQSSAIFNECQITSPNVGVYAQIGAQVTLNKSQISGPNGSLMTTSNGKIVANQCQISGRVQGNVKINP